MNNSKKLQYLLVSGLLIAVLIAFFLGQSYESNHSLFRGGKYKLDESISGSGYQGLRNEVIEFQPKGQYQSTSFKGHWKREGSIVVVDELWQGNMKLNQSGVRTIGGIRGYFHYDVEIGDTLLFLSAVGDKENLPRFRRIE